MNDVQDTTTGESLQQGRRPSDAVHGRKAVPGIDMNHPNFGKILDEIMTDLIAE